MTGADPGEISAAFWIVYLFAIGLILGALGVMGGIVWLRHHG